MKAEDLMDAIGDARDSYVHQAQQRPRSRKKQGLAALAACLALALGVGLLQGGFGSGGGGQGKDTYMYYAGPVLPLTVQGDSRGLCAERWVDFDFSPYHPVTKTYEMDGRSQSYQQFQSEILVSDRYTISNKTDEDRTELFLYPWMGRLSEPQQAPSILVNGAEISPTLLAGPYPPFMETEARLPLGGFGDLELLLEGGRYQQRALAGHSIPELPVTVYWFTDAGILTGPDKAEPQITVEFSFDPEQTGILSWGFNGLQREKEHLRFENGSSRKHPQGGKILSDACIVVMGQEPQDLTLKKWLVDRTGKHPVQEETEAFSCQMRKIETTMEAVLNQVAQTQLRAWEARIEEPASARMPDATVVAEAIYELVDAYGWSEQGKVSPGPLMLEDLCTWGLENERILYQQFAVTIPAHGSVTVEAVLPKEASRDYTGTHRNLHGYELAAQLDSNLCFTKQTASLSSAEQLQLVEQNFGFDPEHGVWEVTLDPEIPRYWMKLAPPMQ